jgi:hypothetical protein
MFTFALLCGTSRPSGVSAWNLFQGGNSGKSTYGPYQSMVEEALKALHCAGPFSIFASIFGSSAIGGKALALRRVGALARIKRGYGAVRETLIAILSGSNARILL